MPYRVPPNQTNVSCSRLLERWRQKPAELIHRILWSAIIIDLYTVDLVLFGPAMTFYPSQVKPISIIDLYSGASGIEHMRQGDTVWRG